MYKRWALGCQDVAAKYFYQYNLSVSYTDKPETAQTINIFCQEQKLRHLAQSKDREETEGRFASLSIARDGPPSAPDEADFMVRDSTFLMLSFLPYGPPSSNDARTAHGAHAAGWLAAVLS